MAVQKSKVTRSRRGQRRSHDSIKSGEYMPDQTSGELHQRHCVGADGYYRGRQVVVPKVKASESEEE